MNKLLLTVLVLVSLLLAPFMARAEEITVDTGTVVAIDEPILYSEENQQYYTQRVLVRIDSGYYKNLESETVYTFPVPGMKRALKVNDRLEITYDSENASQPLRILNFERRSVLAIVPILLIFAVAAVFIRKKMDFVYILFTFLCPVLTVVAIYFAKLPPILSATAIATILGSIVLLMSYSKLIPALSALLSFFITYGVGTVVIYAISNTLNIFTGIFEPLLAYTGIPLPENMPGIITAGLLVIPFAAILAVVLSIVNRVIRARSVEGLSSRAELVKLGLNEGLAVSKDAVFSFFSIALGFLIPIVIALASTQPLIEIVNGEIFSFLILLGISPVFMCLVAIFTSAIITGLLLGSATPYRLVTEKEAKDLFPSPSKSIEPQPTQPQDQQKS